jgi:Zn-dependent M28 family amino/carboxypeptidase
MSYNVIAEIPGTDLKDELVMLGAHFDSWHSGTGATDNAAGSAVCLEAVRILQTLGLKPRRTIRIGLWSGEEQGLLGSRAYVAEHFGKRIGAEPRFSPCPPAAREQNQANTPPQFELKPEREKVAGYFNLDNGTGKIRGIYMQGNEEVRSIFQAWFAPFKDMVGTTKDNALATLSIANTGGTDHLSFDAIGLPGFQFIQDPIEYDTRTHHSNMDVYDRIQEDDMKQAATIMAAFVYNTAMRDEKLPRKALPGQPVARTGQ